MPNLLGMSFDQCVSRFSGVPSIDDAEAFCGSLEKLIGFGKSMTLKRDAVAVICPPCAGRMKILGQGALEVGGKLGIPTELSKRLHRMAGGFHVKLPVVKGDGDAADGSEGLVTGWAAVVTAEDGTPLIDFDGDIIPVSELEKAAHAAFARDSGKDKAGDMHEVTGVADVVESMVFTAEKRKKLKLGPGQEGWAVTLKINDPELLKQIQSGEKSELSIRGKANRIPVEGTDDDIAVLQDLELSVVELLSVVDAGASGDIDHRPSIVLVKRGTQVSKSKPPIKLIDRIAKMFAKDPKIKISAVQAAIRKQAEEEEMDEEKTLESVLAEMDDEEKAIVVAALAAAAKQEPEEEEEDEEEEEVAAAIKSLHPAIRKQLEAGAEAATEVAKLREERDLEECMVKARKLTHLSGASVEEIGVVLKSIQTLPEDEQKTLNAILKSTNQVMATSEIFTEHGTKRPAPDSARAEFEGEIDKALAADPKLVELKRTKPEVARSKAMLVASRTHQDVYKRMRAEEH